jgi:competence protein ComEC
MILGDKGRVPASLREAMMTIGTWHVLVVSGGHTALLGALLLMMLKILRVPRRARFILAMVFLAFYCLLTGGSPPVLRATVMACVFFSGFLLERAPLFGNSLALAGLIILGFDPQSLSDLGFQLSFVSVFSIAYLSPKLEGFMPDPWHERPALFWPCRMFCVSLAAWLGTTPLIAQAFGRFSLLTVIANLIVVPMATLVMICGLALVLFSFFSAPVATLAAPAVEAVTSIFFRLNIFLSKCPGAGIQVPGLSWWVVPAFYLFLGAIIVAGARRVDFCLKISPVNL